MTDEQEHIDKMITDVNERIKKFKKMPKGDTRLKYLHILQKEKLSWVNYAISLKKEQEGIQRLKGEKV